MKRFLIILMAALLIGVFISCNEKRTKETPVAEEIPEEITTKETPVPEKIPEEITKENLYQLGLGREDIPRIIDELKQKGITAEPWLGDAGFLEFIDADEYLVGLYKLNQLTKEEAEQAKLNLVKIKIHNFFLGSSSDNFRAELVIDWEAPTAEIKNHVLKNAEFAYSEHLEEVVAHKECIKIAEFLRSRGLSNIQKNLLIDYRDCLIGLKKLTFLTVHQIEVINLRKMTIEIGVEFSPGWDCYGKLIMEIDYRASLKEIIEYLQINF